MRMGVWSISCVLQQLIEYYSQLILMTLSACNDSSLVNGISIQRRELDGNETLNTKHTHTHMYV